MTPSRWVLIGLMIFLSASVSVQAQRRWQRLPVPRDPQFYEPRNKLEEFDGRMETLLIKGRTWVGNLRVQNGSLRVEAIEIRDTLDSSHANGVIITILPAETNAPAEEIRSLIDYDEIDKLVNVLDTMAKAGDSVTKLRWFIAQAKDKLDEIK